MTRLSLRDAIDRHCRNCIYDKLAPGAWREQVDGCSSSNCALHPVRPRSTGSRVKAVSSPENAPAQADAPEVAAQNGSAPLDKICGLNAPIFGQREAGS